jgi:hypothetical protein
VGSGYAAAVGLLFQIIGSIQVLSGVLSVLRRAMLGAEWELLFVIPCMTKVYRLLLIGGIETPLERN